MDGKIQPETVWAQRRFITKNRVGPEVAIHAAFAKVCLGSRAGRGVQAAVCIVAARQAIFTCFLLPVATRQHLEQRIDGGMIKAIFLIAHIVFNNNFSQLGKRGIKLGATQ